MTNIEKYVQAFVDAFKVDVNSAKGLSYHSIPAWDSVGHMELIAKLEGAFGVEIDPDDIVDILSFEKGKEILSAKYAVSF